MTAISEAEMVGRRFGKLIVLGLAERRGPHGGRYWVCRCDCGFEKAILGHSLRSGNTKTCGVQCVRTFKHGHSSSTFLSPTYNSWMAMKARCRQGGRKGAKYYIGRGISYDPRWEDFATFLADMGERPAECNSLDRRDNDQGYFKENCRWSTPIEQTNNRRNTKFYTQDGRTLPVAEWARERGISYMAARMRIIRHGSLELPT
jgi:hypothetical protein